MLGRNSRLALVVVCFSFLAAQLSAQGRPDPAALVNAQKQAMKALSFMDGAWRGPAWSMLPSGEKHPITQTERVGPFLDGSLKMVEGKGYEADGKVGFNALGIISYNPSTKAYSIRSHAMGYAGDFALTPKADGFTWEMQMGGRMSFRYTASFTDGKWHEVGDRLTDGKDPVRIFEMTLERIGNSDWPAGNAIPMK